MTLNRKFVFWDKSKVRTFSYGLLVLLLLDFFVLPMSGRAAAAMILLPAAVIIFFLSKKRSIPSLNSKMVLLIMVVIGLLYVTLYYLTGIVYGLYYAPVRLSFRSFFEYILPITVIIASSEVVRTVLLARDKREFNVLAYLICFVSEILIDSNLEGIRTFNQFSDFIGYALFPAVTANLLYHYLSKRYGLYPNVAYRLITTLFPYIIPYISQINAALYSFARLIVPLVIIWFVDLLYEKKIQYALGKKSKWAGIITGVVVVLLLAFVMLISCQFKYGMIVIATESMSDEINRGDAIIFTRYDDQTIEEGQVIVFKRNKNMIVHRVVEIQNINGVARYYTKGDANEDIDAGYVIDSEIIGLTNYKVAFIGMPTLWMRALFS